MHTVLLTTIATLVVALVSVGVIYSRRAGAVDRAVRELDKFARDVDLALTEDVQPALLASFVQKDRRANIALAVVLTASTLVLLPAFTSMNREAGGPSFNRAFGTFAIEALTLLLILGVVSTFVSYPVRWPTTDTTSLAHARRTSFIDYVDPVIGLTSLAVVVSLVTLCATLLVWPGQPAGVSSPLIAWGFMVAFSLEYVWLVRRRLAQRPRAGTIQQLAFNDALTCRDLANLPSLSMIAFFLTVTLNSQAPFGLQGFLQLMGVVYLVANLVQAVRGQRTSRRFKARLYPDAPGLGGDVR